MLLEKVQKTLQFYEMVQPGDRVVVGVSGGVDSMVLLHLLDQISSSCRINLFVAHLNHGLRGEESEKEAQFVAEAARSLDFPYRTESTDVQKTPRDEKLSIQEAARLLRYQFFLKVLEEEGAQKIALGHHADDQAETIMMRLLRGTGPGGLGGIPPVREGKIIRPLCLARKTEIEAYARDHKINFVTDSSNQQDKYLRNTIRHSPSGFSTDNPGGDMQGRRSVSPGPGHERMGEDLFE